MITAFHAAPLSDDQAPQALPLIRATWPGIDLATWRGFVRYFADAAPAEGSGILGLFDDHRSLCGVMAYRREPDLVAGPILRVQLFTAVDVANSPRPIASLLAAAETTAGKLGCSGVEIRLQSDQAALSSRLRRMGLVAATLLIKTDLERSSYV